MDPTNPNYIPPAMDTTLDAGRTALGLAIFFTLLTVAVPLSRWWIMRHQSQTTTDKISSGLFYFASLLVIAISATLTHACWERYELTKQLDGLQLMLALLGQKYIKLFFILGVIYVAALWVLKGAFLAFYWRLFSRTQSKLVYILYTAIVIWAAAGTACWFYFVFGCFPIANNWSSDLEVFESCSVVPSLVHNTITVFLNIFVDIIVLLVPLFIISSLQLPRREKFGLVGVFAIGSMSIIASAARYSVIYGFITKPPLTPAGVRTQELWSIIELLSGMIAYTLPSFRVLIKRRAKARTERGTTHSGSNMSVTKKSTFNNGQIYVRHDIEVKSMDGNSDHDLEMGHIRRGNSDEGLVKFQIR